MLGETCKDESNIICWYLFSSPMKISFNDRFFFFFFSCSLSLIFHLFQSISYFIAWKIVNNFLFSSPVTPVSEYLPYTYISFT